jgi:hypothetical protein
VVFGWENYSQITENLFSLKSNFAVKQRSSFIRIKYLAACGGVRKTVSGPGLALGFDTNRGPTKWGFIMLNFFKRIFNIGGVKLELVDYPRQIDQQSRTFECQVKLTTSTEKTIKGVTVKLVETYKTGRGEDAKEQKYDWGEAEQAETFVLKPGEEKLMKFTVGFKPIMSDNQSLAQEGGALGGLGKLATFAGGEKSTFEIEADASLEGTFWTASDKKDVQMINGN